MKKLIAFVLIMICVFGLASCGSSETEYQFHATVIEKTDDYLLVEPVDGSSERDVSDKIQIGLKDRSNWPMPQVGELVRVVYDGYIQESYPAYISKPYRVEIIIETTE